MGVESKIEARLMEILGREGREKGSIVHVYVCDVCVCVCGIGVGSGGLCAGIA